MAGDLEEKDGLGSGLKSECGESVKTPPPLFALIAAQEVLKVVLFLTQGLTGQP